MRKQLPDAPRTDAAALAEEPDDDAMSKVSDEPRDIFYVSKRILETLKQYISLRNIIGNGRWNVHKFSAKCSMCVQIFWK